MNYSPLVFTKKAFKVLQIPICIWVVSMETVFVQFFGIECCEKNFKFLFFGLRVLISLTKVDEVVYITFTIAKSICKDGIE